MKKILEEIGMTSQEVDVYMALLTLGSSPTTPIIKKAKIHSSNVYSILDRLQEKGLVSKVKRDKKIFYKACNPNMLVHFLEEKQRSLDSQIVDVRNILPMLDSMQPQEDEEVQVFLGWKGLKTAFYSLLADPGHTQYVVGATYIPDLVVHNTFFSQFRKERDKDKIKTKIVFSENARGKFPDYERSPFTQIRYIDHVIPTAIDVYLNTTLITLMRKNPIIIQIKSKSMAKSFVKYFSLIWAQAKK